METDARGAVGAHLLQHFCFIPCLLPRLFAATAQLRHEMVWTTLAQRRRQYASTCLLVPWLAAWMPTSNDLFDHRRWAQCGPNRRWRHPKLFTQNFNLKKFGHSCAKKGCKIFGCYRLSSSPPRPPPMSMLLISIGHVADSDAATLKLGVGRGGDDDNR